MLCEIAPGFTGCSEYFPIGQDQTAQHGNFLIKNISKIDTNAVCHRVFEVINTGNICRKSMNFSKYRVQRKNGHPNIL